VKFGLPRISGDPALALVDNAYVGRNQQSAVGAPSTPEVFSGQEGNAYNWLYWHASTGAVGYELYQVSSAGTFIQLITAPLTSPTYLHWAPPLTNCAKYRYVVAAINSQGKRSVFSEPLELMPRDSTQPPC
jgi:hypothetical protein